MAGTTAGGRRKHVVKMLPCCSKITTEGFGFHDPLTLEKARKMAGQNRRLIASLKPTPAGHSRSTKE